MLLKYSPVLLLILGLASILIWRAASAAPDGRLHLIFFDVGSGDGILVQTPTGRRLLVDGGPSSSKLSQSLGRRLPLLERSLDYLIVAAPGEEHIGALAKNVVRYPPDKVLWAGSTAGTHSARILRRTLVESQVPVILMKSGQVIQLGKGAEIQVLSADGLGAVLCLAWDNFRAVLPIGMNFETMDRLLADKDTPPASVLLLAESGYSPINSPEWLRKWNPQLVLLSVGAGDQDGLPDQETLEAVAGYNLLRTDMNGWIHLSTDGKSMWIEVESSWE